MAFITGGKHFGQYTYEHWYDHEYEHGNDNAKITSVQKTDEINHSPEAVSQCQSKIQTAEQ